MFSNKILIYNLCQYNKYVCSKLFVTGKGARLAGALQSFQCSIHKWGIEAPGAAQNLLGRDKEECEEEFGSEQGINIT
jgi:hypothetical protein